MKKLILSAIFALLCAISFAQKVQFSDTSNVWCWSDSTIGCCIITAPVCTIAYYDTTTFTYHGHTYQSLINSINNILVRENADKVYVLDGVDSLERVMYDFTLSVGDTLSTSYPQDLYTVWVTKIDSTQIAATWYKVWHFAGLDSMRLYTDSTHPISYNVIEGIGCTNGVGYPISPYYRDAYFQHLLCFKNDSFATPVLSVPVASFSNNYIGGYFDNDSSCALFDTAHHGLIFVGNGVRQLTQPGNFVSVIPNPANESGKIVFSSTISSGTLVVINSIGQTIISQSFQNKDELPIGDKIKLPGIYCYRITDNETGNVFSGKFAGQ